MDPLNSDHLWTTATFFESQGWLLYSGLTVIHKFFKITGKRLKNKETFVKEWNGIDIEREAPTLQTINAILNKSNWKTWTHNSNFFFCVFVPYKSSLLLSHYWAKREKFFYFIRGLMDGCPWVEHITSFLTFLITKHFIYYDNVFLKDYSHS